MTEDGRVGSELWPPSAFTPLPWGWGGLLQPFFAALLRLSFTCASTMGGSFTCALPLSCSTLQHTQGSLWFIWNCGG